MVAPPGIDRTAWVELAVMIAMASLTTAFFWLSNCDVTLQKMFFDAASNAAWSAGDAALWDLLYRATPIFTGALALWGLIGIMLGSWFPRLCAWRLRGLYLILCIALGPGLVVNIIFKDHWGRPRPRQVKEFGGRLDYLPPLAKGVSGQGKSFPCGHCSVGFVLTAFYFLNRRRHLGRALTWLAAAVAAGLFLGAGRMAAGAHFASDVLWAGYLTFGVCWTLYYVVLRIPVREGLSKAKPPISSGTRLATATAGLFVLVVAGVLLATPVHHDPVYVVQRDQLGAPLEQIRISVSTGDLTIRLVPPRGTEVVRIHGTIRGFGLPTNEIDYGGSIHREGDAASLDYRVRHEGLFTDLESSVELAVAAPEIRRLVIEAPRERVRVVPEAGGPSPAVEFTDPLKP
jgi:membrane-associated PAP2 superfamily phosphatase